MDQGVKQFHSCWKQITLTDSHLQKIGWPSSSVAIARPHPQVCNRWQPVTTISKSIVLLCLFVTLKPRRALSVCGCGKVSFVDNSIWIDQLLPQARKVFGVLLQKSSSGFQCTPGSVSKHLLCLLQAAFLFVPCALSAPDRLWPTLPEMMHEAIHGWKTQLASKRQNCICQTNLEYLEMQPRNQSNLFIRNERTNQSCWETCNSIDSQIGNCFQTESFATCIRLHVACCRLFVWGCLRGKREEIRVFMQLQFRHPRLWWKEEPQTTRWTSWKEDMHQGYTFTAQLRHFNGEALSFWTTAKTV